MANAVQNMLSGCALTFVCVVGALLVLRWVVGKVL